MNLIWILAGIAAALLLTIAVATWICFRMAFYVPPRKEPGPEGLPLPKGEVYVPFREIMTRWITELRAMPYEDVSVVSFDGLTLRGKFYECMPNAPIELMFHGYRGKAECDLCGGVKRCFALGHSALIVDQRACGRSDGRVISFGTNESKDCHTWIQFILDHYGTDSRILLTGISMGAATVLIAAGDPLPENVIGVLADCGYSSAEDIIKKVIRDMKLPPNLAYPFVRLAAKVLGGFDLADASPVNAVKNCKIPVILFHGEDDDFVPCEMSRTIYQNCPSPKKIVTIPGAGHGLSYPVDPARYLQSLKEFWETHT